MHIHTLTLSACFFTILSASETIAAVVIDNLTLGSQSSSQNLSGPTATTGFLTQLPFPNREVAFSFTTASADVYLTELAIGISISKTILDPIHLTLSTGSSVPGGINPLLIGTVVPGSSSPTSQILTLLPSGSVLLLASTTYWIHLTVPSGAALYSFQNTNSQNIEPGWALGNSWSKDPSNPWSELTSGPQARIRMSVAAIPEPTVLGMSAVGLLFLLRRRVSS
jgi:hypothetical protein